MIRQTLPILLLSALVFLAGCSGKTAEGTDIDPEAAAGSLVESVTFKDNLVVADAASAETFYKLDDKVDSYCVYVSGSGATAEEVAVIKMKDAADANEALVFFEARRADLIARFQDYAPAEMAKLQNPALAVKGPVAIMVLADDLDQAQSAADAVL